MHSHKGKTLRPWVYEKRHNSPPYTHISEGVRGWGNGLTYPLPWSWKLGTFKKIRSGEKKLFDNLSLIFGIFIEGLKSSFCWKNWYLSLVFANIPVFLQQNGLFHPHPPPGPLYPPKNRVATFGRFPILLRSRKTTLQPGYPYLWAAKHKRDDMTNDGELCYSLRTESFLF